MGEEQELSVYCQRKRGRESEGGGKRQREVHTHKVIMREKRMEVGEKND